MSVTLNKESHPFKKNSLHLRKTCKEQLKYYFYYTTRSGIIIEKSILTVVKCPP